MPERTFYPVEPFGRHTPGQRIAMQNLADQIGLHLICPFVACRRGRHCRDPDPNQLPFCFWQHRGTVRFVLASSPSWGTPPPALADDEPEPEPPARAKAPPPSETLLGRLQASGIDTARLQRRREDGADEWTWENNEVACGVVTRERARRASETGSR